MLSIDLVDANFDIVSELTRHLTVVAKRQFVKLQNAICLDGNESADKIDGLTAIEPVQGATPAVGTEIRVLADAKNLYIGVRCYDDPDQLSAFAERARSSTVVRLAIR